MSLPHTFRGLIEIFLRRIEGMGRGARTGESSPDFTGLLLLLPAAAAVGVAVADVSAVGTTG